MIDTGLSGESTPPLDRDEIMSGLFANLVMQQTNMTLMLLGRVPHPETGQTVREIDGAQMFIDQLEMIEIKTRGNLNPMEDKLLKQSLTAVRLAFVEAINEDSRDGSPVSAGAKPPEATAERRTKYSKTY